MGGELLRGVSGGERKRVSIGVELVKGPGILLLDEPTTGLDSAAAMDVIKSLRTLAQSGIPVICSLLQPSQDLYEMFDYVMLMNNRRVSYFGPSSEVLSHFEEAGYHCPDDKNIAEFLLDICTPRAKSFADERAISDINAYYKRSAACQVVENKLWQGVSPEDHDTTILKSKTYFATGTMYQTAKCTQRALQNLFRNRRAFFARVIRAILIGLIIGTLFWDMPFSQAGTINRVSLLFFCITFTVMGSIASIPQVCEERRIFYHQRAAHFYRTIAYFLSSIVMDIPLTVMESFIFSTIVFWMTGMNNKGTLSIGLQTGQFVLFFSILLLTSLCAKQWCRVSAAATPNLSLASSLAPAVLCIWLLFAGFLIPRSSIPIYWAPVNVISTFRYTFEALCINQFYEFSCSVDGGGSLDPNCGTNVLNSFGLNDGAAWLVGNISTLFFFYVLFCTLTFICLKYLNFMVASAPPMFMEDLKRLIQGGASAISQARVDESDPLMASATESKYQEEQEERHGKTLSFFNLTYSVTEATGPFAKCRKNAIKIKTLLHGIEGYAEPFRMIALMGASGAGKTTLLDVLAQRKTGGITVGSIMVDGKLKDSYYNRLVGYVEQTNVFLPTQTVVETIEFNARMRLPKDLPESEKKRRIQEVLRSVELSHVASRPVGTPETGGLSPELRKKLSIACELVADPAILFLDEPTSGLDSQAAENVMKAARSVCNSGVPVICTIHQPSAELFLMFDSLLCLKPGGETIYFGELGKNAQTVLNYFGRFGLTCEARRNPADFVLDCSGAGIQSSDLTNPISQFQAAQAWKQSAEFREANERLAVEAREAARSKGGPSATGFNSPYAISLLDQLKLSVGRAFKNKFRQPQVNRIYIVTYGIMGIILGSLYFQLGEEQVIDARNRIALIYFMIVFSALGAIAAIPGLILQRAVYYREKPAFLRPVAYFIATVLSELPVVMLSSLMMGLIVYFSVGMNLQEEGLHLLIFCILYVIACTSCVAFAMAIASAVATTEVANTLVGVSSTIFSLFAGFIIPKESIPILWRWVHYIDFYSYALESLSINELNGLTFCCNSATDVGCTGPLGNCSSATSTGTITGASYLNITYNMDSFDSNGNPSDAHVYYDLTILTGFLFFFIFLCYCGIKFINHLKR